MRWTGGLFGQKLDNLGFSCLSPRATLQHIQLLPRLGCQAKSSRDESSLPELCGASSRSPVYNERTRPESMFRLDVPHLLVNVNRKPAYSRIACGTQYHWICPRFRPDFGALLTRHHELLLFHRMIWFVFSRSEARTRKGDNVRECENESTPEVKMAEHCDGQTNDGTEGTPRESQQRNEGGFSGSLPTRSMRLWWLRWPRCLGTRRRAGG